MQFGKKPALAIALFLFFASLALRASLTETSPFLIEQARSLELALKIAQGSLQPGGAYSYWMAIPLVFSPTPEAANLWAAFSGAIAVVFCFLAFREWLSLRGAAIGALLMAYSPWALLFSDRASHINVAILPLSAGLYFFARWLREPERLRFWIGLVGCTVVLPQFHLSACIFPTILLPWVIPRLREVHAKGWLAALAIFAVFWSPSVLQELRTQGEATRALFSEVQQPQSSSFLRVPLYTLRFLTLDGTPLEVASEGAPHSERAALEALWKSTPERPLAWPHWLLRLWSWGLALVIIRVALRKTSPLRNLFLAGALTQVIVFACVPQSSLPADATALFPLVFGLAALWGEHALRRRPVSLALVLGAFCIGGTLEATSLSRTFHAKNSLREQRRVVETLLTQELPNAEAKVHFSYLTYPETYSFLARTQYAHDLLVRSTTLEDAEFRADVSENGQITLQKIR